MDSNIFELGLPDEVLEIILEKAAGKRFRFPSLGSKHNPILRKKRDKMICQKRQAGESLENLAKDTKLTTRRIKQILKDNRIRITLEKRKNRKVKLELLLSLGYTRKKIAETLGISRQRLYQIIKEENLINKL